MLSPRARVALAVPALFALAVGLFALLDPTLFDTPSYVAMRSVVPIPGWGVAWHAVSILFGAAVVTGRASVARVALATLITACFFLISSLLAAIATGERPAPVLLPAVSAIAAAAIVALLPEEFFSLDPLRRLRARLGGGGRRVE